MTHLEFRPDLIVEATNACDRVCPGCYAPNVVVEPGTAASAPGAIHLSPESLDLAWPQDKSVGTVSIRGGEPTLNPQIETILRHACDRASTVYLETNGGWIAPGSPLLAVLSERSCVVKLSLDKMHGTSPHEADRKLDILSGAGVKTAIAVTESTPEQFERTRARLLRDFHGQVFWQKKAATKDELIRPVLGVISAKGQMKRGVENLFEGISLSRDA
jgi:organic radical activating enzyme